MMSLPDFILPKIRHIGLSIERQSLHAVELNEKGKPIHLAEIAISSDIFSEGVLIRPEIFIEAVKKLMAAGKFSTPYVAVCFPEVFAYTRGYTVPILPIEEVNEAITWHVKDLFPFPPDEIYFDWKILEKTEKEYHTVVVAVQKKVLDVLVNTLRDSGLNPLRFEPDASALARLIVLKPNQHALLIDINPQGAYVTLVEGDKAIFTTVVNYNQDDSPASYLSNIDQTLMEIETFYKNKGIVSPETTQIIVTGQMASNDWVAHVNQLLKYPASILISAMQHPSFNKAYAAAIEQIAPPIDPKSINLLPYSTQQYFNDHRTGAFFISLFLRASVIAGFICLFAMGTYFVSALERTNSDNQVKTLRKLTETQQTNTQSLLLLNARAKNIVSLAPLKKTPNKQLIALANLLTEKITITQWEFDDSKQQYTIIGTALTREDLLKFKNNLDTSSDFAKVILPLGTLETPMNVPFEITFLIKQ
jgi:Tfp pilus assembly PilM family ATPase